MRSVIDTSDNSKGTDEISAVDWAIFPTGNLRLLQKEST